MLRWLLLAGAQLARPRAEAVTVSAETHAGVEPGERGAKVAGTHTKILAIVVPTPGEGERRAGRCRGGGGSSTPVGQMWRLSQLAEIMGYLKAFLVHYQLM